MTKYTLITVTHGGIVDHARGFESLEMCRQAQSIALTGRTLEAEAELQAQIRAARERADALWRAEHPPRAPVSDSDFKLIEWYKKCTFNQIMGSNVPFSTVEEDGLIYDWPGSASGWGSFPPNPGKIKFAECVIEQ